MKKSEILESLLIRIGRPCINLHDKGTFIKNLLFVRSMIIASEKLVKEAAALIKDEGLKDYLLKHLDEETGHYDWLTEDLKDHLENETFIPEAALLAGSQYYMIYHVDPVAILGYMAALEMIPSKIEDVDFLEELHGKDLCRTLRYHAEHDIDHGNDIRNVVDDLTHDQFYIVMMNAAMVINNLRNSLAKL